MKHDDQHTGHRKVWLLEQSQPKLKRWEVLLGVAATISLLCVWFSHP